MSEPLHMPSAMSQSMFQPMNQNQSMAQPMSQPQPIQMPQSMTQQQIHQQQMPMLDQIPMIAPAPYIDLPSKYAKIVKKSDLIDQLNSNNLMQGIMISSEELQQLPDQFQNNKKVLKDFEFKDAEQSDSIEMDDELMFLEDFSPLPINES